MLKQLNNHCMTKNLTYCHSQYLTALRRYYQPCVLCKFDKLSLKKCVSLIYVAGVKGFIRKILRCINPLKRIYLGVSLVLELFSSLAVSIVAVHYRPVRLVLLAMFGLSSVAPTRRELLCTDLWWRSVATACEN
jgi:hypothetical protein